MSDFGGREVERVGPWRIICDPRERAIWACDRFSCEDADIHHWRHHAGVYRRYGRWWWPRALKNAYHDVRLWCESERPEITELDVLKQEIAERQEVDHLLESL